MKIPPPEELGIDLAHLKWDFRRLSEYYSVTVVLDDWQGKFEPALRIGGDQAKMLYSVLYACVAVADAHAPASAAMQQFRKQFEPLLTAEHARWIDGLTDDQREQHLRPLMDWAREVYARSWA